MVRHPSLSSISRSDTDFDLDPDPNPEIECPFGRIDSLGRTELRQAAYELFFMSCRSSPGFGGSRSSLNYYPALPTSGGGAEGSPRWGSSGMTVARSRIKKTLGLTARRPSPMTMGMSSGGPNSPGKMKRPMTSAEIMRQQMRVTEQNDHRLRKTLMRAIVGQVNLLCTNMHACIPT